MYCKQFVWFSLQDKDTVKRGAPGGGDEGLRDCRLHAGTCLGCGMTVVINNLIPSGINVFTCWWMWEFKYRSGFLSSLELAPSYRLKLQQ